MICKPAAIVPPTGDPVWCSIRSWGRAPPPSLGRSWIGIEINPSYAAMARKRIVNARIAPRNDDINAAKVAA